MNIWQCDRPGCDRVCYGVGGAAGLRAVGWYFTPGMRDNCYCPAHRPDGIPCTENEATQSCSWCAAEKEAKAWQAIIAEVAS